MQRHRGNKLRARVMKIQFDAQQPFQIDALEVDDCFGFGFEKHGCLGFPIKTGEEEST